MVMFTDQDMAKWLARVLEKDSDLEFRINYEGGQESLIRLLKLLDKFKITTNEWNLYGGNMYGGI